MDTARDVTKVGRHRIGLVLFFGMALIGVVFVGLFGGAWGGTRGKHTREHWRFAALFRRGDPSVPLLAMDWFSDHGVYFCRVSQEGKVRSARDVGHAIQGGTGISSSFELSASDRGLLQATIRRLPASAKGGLPKERQVLISAISGGRWIKRVYDRANIPPEVEELYRLTSAYLKWWIPAVAGRLIVHSHYGDRRESQADIKSFFVARDAPTAISAGSNGVQIWDLKRGIVQDVLSMGTFPTMQRLDAAAISPDGHTVAVASVDHVWAMDLREKKLLWSAPSLERDSLFTKRLLIAGRNGEYLFASGGHTLERWDLRNGSKLAVLASNTPVIHILKCSQDGRVLIAGCGHENLSATSEGSFMLWEVDQDTVAHQFTEPGFPGLGLSGDGSVLALSPFGRDVLILYDWKSNRRKEVPLRTPSGPAFSLFWAPNGKRLAAYLDTYPASIVIYDTTWWKPLAQWHCGQIMEHSEFGYDQTGTLFHLRDHDLSGLDVTELAPLAP